MRDVSTLQIPTDLCRRFSEYAKTTDFSVKACARMILEDAIKCDRINEILYRKAMERHLKKEIPIPEPDPISKPDSIPEPDMSSNTYVGYTGMAYDFHALGDIEEEVSEPFNDTEEDETEMYSSDVDIDDLLNDL